MITSDSLRDGAVTALVAANTLAGARVYSPQDWPTWTGIYPLVIIRTPRENAEAIAPRTWPPTFNTVVTLAIECRLDADTEADADAGVRQLVGQIKDGVFRNGQYIYEQQIQAFRGWRERLEITAEGRKHVGQAIVEIDVEILQTFDPTIDAAGNVIADTSGNVLAPALDTVGLRVDATNVYDPSGTYPAPTEPPYTPVSAPRTSGPDGRDEIAADVPLPQ